MVPQIYYNSKKKLYLESYTQDMDGNFHFQRDPSFNNDFLLLEIYCKLIVREKSTVGLKKNKSNIFHPLCAQFILFILFILYNLHSISHLSAPYSPPPPPNSPHPLLNLVFVVLLSIPRISLLYQCHSYSVTIKKCIYCLYN